MTDQLANYVDHQVMLAKQNSVTASGLTTELTEIPDDDSDEEEELVDEDKLAEAQSRASAAVDMLMHVMPDLFPTEEATKEVLNQAISRDDPFVRSILERRTRSIYSELALSGLRNNQKVFYAAIESQLQKQVRPFISKNNKNNVPGTSLRCCLYPFVASTEYRMKTRALETGNIVADCPGISDTDHSRVDETRNCIQDSDIVVVVEDIRRVGSEDQVYKELHQAYKRGGSGGAILVITMIDVRN
jgi:hypothetical protein